RMVTLSVLAFVCGLPGYAIVKVLLPVFYSGQDTRTPVRAGVTALLANVVLTVLFILLLYRWQAPPEVLAMPLLDGIAQVPGLHLGMALAGAASSYINAGLLWYWLRKRRLYRARPGWWRHLLRLALACAVMVVVLYGGLQLW